MFGTRSGVVESFDADAGLGRVADGSGRTWLFHCTTIADGTRIISPGTGVTFHVGPGGPGRWEAFQLERR